MKTTLLARATCLLALSLAPVVSKAQNISIPLRSFEEVPSVSSGARGMFRARIEKGVITYRLSYEGLQGDVRQAHIHLGQTGVNGGVSVFLCQTSFNPDPTGLAPTCPASGQVAGMLLPANIIGPSGQGITAGEFDELLAAMRKGVAYVNVHSTLFPAGEIRGQLDQDD
ncbi:MAG: CHRD domain-containing protein [Pseudoxanthomonas sp.]